jgi:hypothetical protein
MSVPKKHMIGNVTENSSTAGIEPLASKILCRVALAITPNGLTVLFSDVLYKYHLKSLVCSELRLS